jgi:hypothetical protein
MPKATDAELGDQVRKIAKLQREFDRAWEVTHTPLLAAQKLLAKMAEEEDEGTD